MLWFLLPKKGTIKIYVTSILDFCIRLPFLPLIAFSFLASEKKSINLFYKKVQKKCKNNTDKKSAKKSSQKSANKRKEENTAKKSAKKSAHKKCQKKGTQKIAENSALKSAKNSKLLFKVH